MIKLPFRYALSAWYAKLIIDDLIMATQCLTSVGLYHILVMIDPAMAYNQWIITEQQKSGPKEEKLLQNIYRELFPDDETIRVVKDVCIDLKIGEVKVLLWNRINAGYVFRRIYLPAGWKDLFTEDELKAIIGHELGHLKLGSDAMIPMRLVNKIGDEFLFNMLPAHAFGYFLLLIAFMNQTIPYIKMITITLLFRLLHLLIENYFSRKDEYKADQYGVKTTSKETMVKALKKIDRKARAEITENIDQFPAVKQLYYKWLLKKEEGTVREFLLDHPFLSNRLKAIYS